MKPVFAVLAQMRWLRNTMLDPFAYTAERKRELAMVGEFEQRMEELLAQLDRQNLSLAVQVTRLWDKVRGFGHVRMQAYERMLAEEAHLMAEFRAPAQTVNVFDPAASEEAA